MAKTPSLPPNLQGLVQSVGPPVTPKDVAVWERVQEAQDRRFRLRAILRAWDRQQTQDREMRNRYAIWLMVAMSLQSGFINVVFILLGAGVLTVEPWTARTFIMAVFAEIGALVYIVVKYLFAPTSDKILAYTGQPKRVRSK
jgi:hypothetical protein